MGKPHQGLTGESQVHKFGWRWSPIRLVDAPQRPCLPASNLCAAWGVAVASVGDEGARFGVALEGLTEYFLAGRGRLQVVWLGRVLIAHQGNSPGEMFPDAGARRRLDT